MPTLRFVSRDDLRGFYGSDEIPVIDGNNNNINNSVSRRLDQGPSSYRIINEYPLQAPGFTICDLTGLDRDNSTVIPRVLLPRKIIEDRRLPEFAEAVAPLLDSMMPGRWFISDNRLYLYYPKFEITNKNNNKHTIYDMVVRVILSPDYKIGTALYGQRFSFTKAELNAQYIHSHLHVGGYGFDTFCTGAGSPVQKLLANLNKHADVASIGLLLMQIDSYLKWESLEGTPYISMLNVSTNNQIQRFNLAGIDPTISSDLAIAIGSKITLEMVEKFIQPMGGTGLHFNTQNANDLWNLERQATEEILREHPNWASEAYSYEPSMGVYFSGTTQQDNLTLPQFDNEARMCIARFNITPRIIEIQETNLTQTVLRFKPSIVNKTMELLNSYVQLLGYFDGQNNG